MRLEEHAANKKLWGIKGSAYCDSIKKVSIQEGIKSIGDEAFCGCVNMTEIKIPEDVDYIGLDAFCGCKSLTDIKLPDKRGP